MSIKLRLIGGFLGIALLVGITGVIAVLEQLQTAEQTAIIEARDLTEIIALTVLQGEEDLQSFITEIHTSKQRDIEVVDLNKRIIADAVLEDIGTILTHDPGNEVGLAMQDGQVRTFVETSEEYPQGIRQLVAPLKNQEGKIIGAIIVEYTALYEELRNTAEATGRIFATYTFACVILAMALGYFVSTSISGPILKLRDAAVQIEQGQLNVPFPRVGRDEIGQLVASFAHMTDQLLQTQTGLEQRVTERTAELSSSEARFRGLFEYAPISIWEEDFSAVRQYIDDLRRAGVVDFSVYFDAHPEAVGESAARVKIVDVNRATLEMYQAESKEQLLADLSKVLGPESLIPFKEELLALTRGETSFETELINYTLRSEKRVVFLRLTVAPGSEQTWVKVFVGISDITERRQAEAALSAERDLLQALMDNIPDTIYFKDTDSRFTRINRAQVNVLGIAAPEEAIGKTDFDFFQNAELVQSFYNEEQRIIETGQPLINRIEFNPSPDGKPRWFSATKVPIRNPDGRMIGIVGISRDITEQKQAEEARHESEETTRLIIDTALDAVITIDQDGQITRWNDQAETIFGWRRAEAVGQRLSELIIPPDLRAKHERGLKHYSETGEGPVLDKRIEITAQRRNGNIFPVELTIHVLKANNKVSFAAFVRDITERKQAEEALRQSEERFKLMAWATQDAVWDWDLQTRQIWWGEGLQKIFHYSSDTTQTNTEWRFDHIHPEDRAKVDRVINQTLEGGLEFWSKEYRFQRTDGTYADIMDRGYVIRNEAGKPYRMIGAMMDITERRQSEETIRHQNEMLSSLHQMTLDLLRYREIDELLDALVKLSAKFLEAPYAEIMLVEGEMLVVKAATQSQPRSIGEHVGRDAALLSWQAFDTHEPAVLSDYASWPNRQAVYDNFPLHAVVDFPILNDDRCLGVLSLGRHEPDYEFNLNQIQFGRLFANLTALVLNNAQLRAALREQSIRDPLTELYNRRYMQEALNQQLSRVTRQLHPLGLIMIDIDHFKNFNDAYGHAAGDALLRELGKLLQSHIRGGDVACRYGGEEFLLIMPDASLETAHQRAVLLQQEARKLRVQDAGQSLDGITLSLGVAIYPEHGRSIDSVLRAADAALYRAKQEGRDRVVVAERAY